jgi:ATP-dependent RNA helicase DDX18/HAS1
LHESTIKALNNLNFTRATEIQCQIIPLAKKGIDILGTAKTGSGKSLAFLIPAVELLFRCGYTNSNGTGVIILTPTRELATQLYSVAKSLLMFNKKSIALIIGGSYRKKEAKNLQIGANLVIATPGRLLDHLKNTEDFNFQNLNLLVIDEADAILKIGFEDELKEILEILPKNRQTLLFSATLNKKVESLINLSLKDPKFVKIDNGNSATVKNLTQGYVVLNFDEKFLFLYSFIKNNQDKKVMVFFSTCSQVQVSLFF